MWVKPCRHTGLVRTCPPSTATKQAECRQLRGSWQEQTEAVHKEGKGQVLCSYTYTYLTYMTQIEMAKTRVSGEAWEVKVR